jgi:D-glucosaminate-6-phosphate ammonia-lyase
VFGTIEGDQIKLQSTDYRPGDSITFTFSGSLSGDTFSGPVYMGEYLNAKFTAKRHAYTTTRTPIRIPSGRPLAT